MTRTTLVGLAAVVAVSTMPSLAFAQDGGSVGINLRAEVPLFCQISAPMDGQAAQVINGEVSLGSVTELCNSITGYTVQAQFMNVASGDLLVDEAVKPVVAGEAKYSHPRASKRTRFWKLANIALTMPDAPIYIRVSISPI